MTSSRVATATANSTSYVNLLDVNGVDGTLTAVGVASGKNYHYVQITIDGTEVASDLLVGSNATQVTAANGSLGVALPFGKSVLVAVKESPGASPLTSYWAAYVTSHTEPLGEPEIHLFEHDGQRILFEHARFGTAENFYTVDTLLGPLFRSEVQLSSDYYLRGEQIQGAVLLQEGPSGHRQPMSAEVALHVRPYGYSRTLDEVHVGPVEGAREFVYEPGNDLIQAGAFEIVAALPGFANIPAVFFRA